MKEIVQQELPGTFVSASHELSQEYKLGKPLKLDITEAADGILDLSGGLQLAVRGEAEIIDLNLSLPLVTQMYGPAAFRNRDYAWIAEVADMYPACLIGLRAVALMGIRTHRWSH